MIGELSGLAALALAAGIKADDSSAQGRPGWRNAWVMLQWGCFAVMALRVFRGLAG